MTHRLLSALALVTAFALPAVRAQDTAAAKAIYEQSCAGCHATGVLNAPKFGDASMWGPRLKAGIEALVKSATTGTTKGMPPKGGRADLNAGQLRVVIEYMISGGKATANAALAPASGKAAASSPSVASSVPSATPASATAVVAAAPDPVIRDPAPRPAPSTEVNAFNRLLKPLGRFNRPAAESGIHDPANDMTQQLQPPATAFAELPKSMAGNHVDWVKSLDSKRIAPRWDRNDPSAAAVVMDLNIVREVKGSMPDVVYPHKQHTEWLDCSNCHPSIFVPQKGANQISMASILLGQKCGVCHGKVAFPVSECRLCHSKKKSDAVAAGGSKP